MEGRKQVMVEAEPHLLPVKTTPDSIKRYAAPPRSPLCYTDTLLRRKCPLSPPTDSCQFHTQLSHPHLSNLQRYMSRLLSSCRQTCLTFSYSWFKSFLNSLLCSRLFSTAWKAGMEGERKGGRERGREGGPMLVSGQDSLPCSFLHLWGQYWGWWLKHVCRRKMAHLQCVQALKIYFNLEHLMYVCLIFPHRL